MSGRFVRASKYRHVHGEAARKDRCFNNVSPLVTGDGNHISGNSKFLAYATSGGGGPLIVHNRNNVTRIEVNAPTVNVHKAKVLDMEFSPFVENLIAMGSDDCTASVVLLPPEGLTDNITNATASLQGHQKKVLAVKWHPVAENILATASGDHSVKLWDVTKQAEVLAYDDHKDLINNLEFNHNGSRAMTACKDKLMRIFDPRQQGSAQSTEGFGGTKASRCFFMDNLNMIGAVGFSSTSVRRIKCWDPRKIDSPLTTLDIDSSAGVIIPYFDPDNSILYLGGKGDGNIRYYEAVAEAPYFHYLTEFRSTESQKGLCFLPKRACDTTTCEIAHCLRLMRDYIQPVSFQVPRKSDIFQQDIFPDTYAGVPGLSADEWLSGKDKDPVKVSMKPGAADGPAVVSSFTVAKSPADMQKELDAANARIKELEEQLAKLKQ